MNWNLIDEQWGQRHNLKHFSELEATLDKALFNSIGKAEFALLWRWARMSHFRGMMAWEEGKTVEAIRHFTEGAKECGPAIALQPNRVEANFWFSVCKIESARKLSLLYAGRYTAPYLKRAAYFDESFHFAGPLRVIGRFAHLKPRALGGNVVEAQKVYRRTLQLAPGNSTTLLYYADALLTTKDRDPAKEILQELVEAPADPDWVWEQARDKKRAAERLAHLK